MERPKHVLLDARQAAEFLCLSYSTLAKWRTYGTGPAFVKLGGKVAYDLNDLRRFLEERRFYSTTRSALDVSRR